MATQYGMQARKPQPDAGPPGGRKPAMTVIGPVKKNKMGFYKPEGGANDPNPSDGDSGQFMYRPDKDGMRMGAPHMQQPPHAGYPGFPMNNGRQQQMPGGSMPVSSQMSVPRSANNQGVPPPHLGGGVPSSPTRGAPMMGNGMDMGMRGPGDAMRIRQFQHLPMAANQQNPPPKGAAMPSFAGANRFGPGGFDYPSSPQKKDEAQLDLSAFPALGGGPPAQHQPQQPPQQPTQQPRGLGTPSSMGGMPTGYAGDFTTAAGVGLRKPENEEFSMVQHDFPALPGSKPQKASGDSSPQQTPSTPQSPSQQPDAAHLMSAFPLAPGSSGEDRYKLIGLLGIIRMTEQDVSMLALGSDLTTLGLNLNSPEPLYPTFASPWAEGPLRSKEPQFQLPSCYAVKSPGVPLLQRLNQVSDETLLYLFYTSPMDVLQQVAACLLYSRDWRYHKEQKVWITRAPGMELMQKTTTFERGTYIVFDVASWKKVPKELVLHYDLLEERRQMPPLPSGP